MLEHARQRVVEAREHVGVLLAPGRRAQLTPSPRVAHPGPAFVDLRARVSLPVAAEALAETGVGDHGRLHVRGDDLGGADRALEVGGVDHPGREAVVREGAGPGRGLRLAGGSQRCVEPPLPAVLHVPRRLAVAEQQQALHGNHSEADPV